MSYQIVLKGGKKSGDSNDLRVMSQFLI